MQIAPGNYITKQGLTVKVCRLRMVKTDAVAAWSYWGFINLEANVWRMWVWYFDGRSCGDEIYDLIVV